MRPVAWEPFQAAPGQGHRRLRVRRHPPAQVYGQAQTQNDPPIRIVRLRSHARPMKVPLGRRLRRSPYACPYGRSPATPSRRPGRGSSRPQSGDRRAQRSAIYIALQPQPVAGGQFNVDAALLTDPEDDTYERQAGPRNKIVALASRSRSGAWADDRNVCYPWMVSGSIERTSLSTRLPPMMCERRISAMSFSFSNLYHAASG